MGDPDPEHALFAGVGDARIRTLSFERGATTSEHVVTLTLETTDGIRAFRFGGVQELRVAGGFPEVGWLMVHDVRGRQLDNLDVHVFDGEQTDAIEFWAADVEEIVPAR